MREYQAENFIFPAGFLLFTLKDSPHMTRPTAKLPLQDTLVPPGVRIDHREGDEKGTSSCYVSERSYPGIDAILFQVSEDLVDRF